MYVPEEMKLNKLRKVSIRRPKDYFLQYGFRPMSVFSGDEIAPMGERKIDKMHALDVIDAQASYQESVSQQEPVNPAPAPAAAPVPASEPSNNT